MQLSAFPWVQDNPPNPPMSISLLESVQQHVQQEGPHTLTSQTAMYRDKKVLIHVFLVSIAGHDQQLKQKHAFSA